MRLKKIKLAGFKSFVDPTSIPFPHDMTAIVGPNGCGKSNVIDAVRWVLGESSAKNLRGDAMTDVIFNGSSARKPVSQCSVELVFDNSSGRLQGEYANYNELSVKRLVTREAQSFYFLNSQKCRRKDVTDLFLGTGLGPRSYAIIEQGMISRLIESKPHELRVFIEEAAGISKYKERRKETESRIRHTTENLERLNDVLHELGQQIEKLQRQAAAAKRYSELKHTERTLKGELAVIRWKQFDDKRSQLEQQAEELALSVEDALAGQSGNESKLIELKVEQQRLQLVLSDIQQAQFALNTDITRAEQNQLHSKQRQHALTEEIEQLKSAKEELEQNLFEDEQLIEQVSEQFTLIEEQLEVQSEIEFQANETFMELDDAVTRAKSEFQSKHSGVEALKLKLAELSSELASKQSLSARTQVRIEELNNEVNTLNEEVDDEIDTVQANVEQLSLLIDEQQATIDQVSEQKEALEDTISTLQEQIQRAASSLASLKAQSKGLQQVIQARNALSGNKQAWLDTHRADLIDLWDWLSVEPGWEKAVELIFKHWCDGYLVVKRASWNEGAPISLLVLDEFVTDKKPGSVASKILNNTVPDFLNYIQCADEQAGLSHSVLGVIEKTGNWTGTGWQLAYQMDSELSLIELANQKTQVEAHIDEVQVSQAELESQLDAIKQQRQLVDDSLHQKTQHLVDLKNQHTTLQTQITVLENKHALRNTQREKLKDELSKQQQLLENELEQISQLSDQVEECELEYEDDVEQHVVLQQNLDNQVVKFEQAKANFDQTKQQILQLNMQYQDLERQKDKALQTKQRSLIQLDNQNARLEALNQELNGLTEPAADLEERMQIWLEQREELVMSQTEAQNLLADTESQMSLINQEYKTVADRVQSKRQELESVRLSLEGVKVNAENQLEALKQLDQTLLDVLDRLSAEADEVQWQSQLDKTTSAISRLGAVNLAAVEEYQAQSERKAHLDEQYEDLQNALETLEQAIRKIDRETRGRFKTTFEQVNHDFQRLFPKVFEGGSATLELTGDDLLETGVSIMAQPPGKKNSTIHLLSGGEKALAALSLVFSIFRLNPAPFCLLDEVDAPLDDANVGRFCNLVSEMSSSVQFIYITHNKIAMEMASHLTGVTMAEPGVSRMVAVDVDEAVALAAL